MVAGLIAFVGVATGAAADDCSVAPAAADLDAEEGHLLILVNEYRQANQLAALAQSTTLRRAAAWMSVDSAERGDSPGDHTDTLGRSTGLRLEDCGYAGFSGTWAYAENICCSGTTVEGGASVFGWWQGSSGHNANMLDPRYQYVGVGRECLHGRCYWTLDLGTHPSGETEDVPVQADDGGS